MLRSKWFHIFQTVLRQEGELMKKYTIQERSKNFLFFISPAYFVEGAGIPNGDINSISFLLFSTCYCVFSSDFSKLSFLLMSFFCKKKKVQWPFHHVFFLVKIAKSRLQESFFLLSLLHISWDWVTFLPGFAVHLFQNKSYFVLEKEIWREDETTRVFQNRKDGLFGPFVLNLRFFEALKCPSFSVIAWLKSCETKSKQIHGL